MAFLMTGGEWGIAIAGVIILVILLLILLVMIAIEVKRYNRRKKEINRENNGDMVYDEDTGARREDAYEAREDVAAHDHHSIRSPHSPLRRGSWRNPSYARAPEDDPSR
mmetsp:Transcript_2992/g.11450  ORF Transcript_2992/g.11450 Transcript_2992/m.11450 type:complete len:109 (-) Transcript_2992:1115-1441(-)